MVVLTLVLGILLVLWLQSYIKKTVAEHTKQALVRLPPPPDPTWTEKIYDHVYEYPDDDDHRWYGRVQGSG